MKVTSNLVVKSFNYLGWILYLGLFSTTILFTREAMEKFFSGDTGIKQYEERRDLYHPTITMCIGNASYGELYKYERDFNMTYAIVAEDYKTIIDRASLNIGKNELNSAEGVVYLNEIYTYSSGLCYNLTTTRKVDLKYTEIEIFSNEKPLPQMVFYFTSEKNSYGIIWGSWKDGKTFSFHKDTNKKGKYLELFINKFVNLECKEETFYECVGSKIMKADFSKCSHTCMPITFPNVKYPLCEKFEEWYIGNCTECACNADIIQDIVKNVELNQECEKPTCHTTQYLANTGQDLDLTVDQTNGDYSVDRMNAYYLQYRFAAPLKAKVFKEYVIYDVIGMIGLVGGTLGLFIGFSFSNVLTYMIQYLQSIILNVCIQNSNTIDDENVCSHGGKPDNDREWEQKLVTMETELAQLKKEKFELAEEMQEKLEEDRTKMAKIEKDLAKFVMQSKNDRAYYQRSKF